MASTAPAAGRLDRGPGDPQRARAERRRAWFGDWRSAELLHRESLAPGFEQDGPCLVQERHSITVVEPGWSMRVDDAKALVLRRMAGP